MGNDETENQGLDDSPGLPGVRSWRAVYLVVFGTFIVWIALLTALTGFFS